MKRALRIFLLMIPITLIGLLVFALGTNSGLQWILQQTVHSAGGQLSYASIEGRLLGTVTIEQLHYDSPDVDVRVRHTVLHWRPGALLRGTVQVQALNLDGVQIHYKTAVGQDETSDKLPEVKLPLRIVIDALKVKDIQWRQADTRQALDSIHMQGQMDDQGIRLAELHMVAGTSSLNLSGTLEPKGDYSLNLKADWQTTPEGMQALYGSTQLTGSLKQLTLAQQTRGALVTTLQATIYDVVQAVSWQAELQLKDFNLAQLGQDYPTGMLNGTFLSQGKPGSFELSSSVQGSLKDVGKVNAKLQGQVLGKTMQIKNLHARLGQNGSSLDAQGTVTWEQQPLHFDLSGQWQNLAWPLTASVQQVRSEQGRFQINGTTKDYAFNLDTRLQANNAPEAVLNANGNGNQQQLQLTRLHIKILEGQVDARGTVSWSPTLNWSGSFSAAGINPGAYWPQWPGRLQAKGKIEAKHTVQGITANVVAETINGKLREYPVAASGELSIKDQDLNRLQLQASSGSARLQLSGSVMKNWNLEWRFNAPDLDHVLTAGKGALQLDGRIQGTRKTPRASGTLKASQLKITDYGAEALEGQFAIGLSQDAPFDLQIKARQLVLREQQWQQASIDGSGTAARHQLELKLTDSEEYFNLNLQGGLISDRHWRGELVRADLRRKDIGTWQLASAGQLNLAPGNLQLGPLCWAQGNANLCLQAQQDKTVWTGSLKANELPFTLAQFLLPEGMQVSGNVSGDIEIHSVARRNLMMRANINSTAGEITYAKQSLKFGAATLEANAEPGNLQARLQIPVEQNGSVSGQLQLPGWQFDQALATQQLHGGLDIELPSLAKLGPLVPEVDNLQGMLKAHLTAKGTLHRINLQGDATVSDGRVDIPALGVAYQDITLNLRGENDSLAYNGSMQSAKGTLRLTGTTTLDAEKGWPSRVQIEGENFEAVHIPQAVVLISPKLNLQMQGSRIDLQGEVTIPRANIKAKGLPKGAVPVSDDVVVIGQPGTVEQEKPEHWQIHTNVRLVLGDKVNFEGFDLRGRLTGSLMLIDEPGKLTLGHGEVGIDKGIYKIYGKELIIDQGSLIFADSVITNPGVNLRATRTVQDVTAGIHVTGTLEKPTISLFSNPPMSDADVLAYILTGRPLSEASSGEGSQMMTAAASLGLAGGEKLVTSIGASLGLEEVRIERGSSLEESRLVVGHYISPKLYVRYAAGLFEEVNVLQLRYDLSKHFQLQTETGDVSGFDLFYTIGR